MIDGKPTIIKHPYHFSWLLRGQDAILNSWSPLISANRMSVAFSGQSCDINFWIILAFFMLTKNSISLCLTWTCSTETGMPCPMAYILTSRQLCQFKIMKTAALKLTFLSTFVRIFWSQWYKRPGKFIKGIALVLLLLFIFFLFLIKFVGNG